MVISSSWLRPVLLNISLATRVWLYPCVGETYTQKLDHTLWLHGKVGRARRRKSKTYFYFCDVAPYLDGDPLTGGHTVRSFVVCKKIASCVCIFSLLRWASFLVSCTKRRKSCFKNNLLLEKQQFNFAERMFPRGNHLYRAHNNFSLLWRVFLLCAAKKICYARSRNTAARTQQGVHVPITSPLN